MNPRRSFLRKIGYLAGIALLLVPLFWLSQPSTLDVNGAKGSPGGKLAQLREGYRLGQTDLGEIDPAGQTVKLATLGMSGIAADILWEKANLYKMKKDWTDLSATLKQIRKLQPNFIGVWRFQGWNLSYNVSHEFDDYRDRYRWVIRGIEFLKEGIKYNEHEPILQWDVGWFIGHKIGKSDEKKQFRKLFKEDDDFHGSRPMDQRDNWLVGREWFLAAEELVDTEGAKVRGVDPVIFRSDAPMWMINYADALEGDGTFGEVAKRAWSSALADWRRFGRIEVPATNGRMIRLGEKVVHQGVARRLSAELEALQPGLRGQIVAEKRAQLSPAEREVLDMPREKLTDKQYQLSLEAQERLRVAHAEVARRITAPNHRQALELARQIEDLEDLVGAIERYREIVNYDYWYRRMQMEQTDEAVNARKLVHEGDRAFNDADLLGARKAYEQGMALWRKALDQFPQLIGERTTGDTLMDVIKRYRQILAESDEPFPKNFILQDILDKYEIKEEPSPKKP